MKTEIKKPEISHYIDYLTEKEEILNLQDKASYKGKNYTSLLGGYLIPKCEPFREMFRPVSYTHLTLPTIYSV